MDFNEEIPKLVAELSALKARLKDLEDWADQFKDGQAPERAASTRPARKTKS